MLSNHLLAKSRLFILFLLVQTLEVASLESNEAPNHHRTPRIIGGQEAPVGKWPWMVYVRETRYNSFCGGSLIHPYWVLTAAHCLDALEINALPLRVDELFVVVGLHQQSRIGQEGEYLKVSRIIQHPQWDSENRDSPFDIALLQLTSPSTQSPVKLSMPESGPINLSQMATALGWGYLSADEIAADEIPPISDELQEIELPLVSNATCQAAYTGEYQIADNMLCAGLATGKKDTCVGDSGGPLVVFENDQWQQVGIVSHGGKLNGPLCGGSHAYGIYTRVSEYIDFIAQYVPLALMGGYDGVWTSPTLPDDFVILRNTTDEIAMVFLTENGQSWQALLGPATNSTMTLTNLISPVQMVVELKVVTPSPPVKQATLTMITCQSQSGDHSTACLLSEGTTIELRKIF